MSALQFDNTLLDKVFQKSSSTFVVRGRQRVQGVSATKTSDAYPGPALKDNSVLDGIDHGFRVFFETSCKRQPSDYAPASLSLTSPVNAFTEVCMHFFRNRISLTVMAFGAASTAKFGKRFWIENATVWQLYDDEGTHRGQAAMILQSRDLES